MIGVSLFLYAGWLLFIGAVVTTNGNAMLSIGILVAVMLFGLYLLGIVLQPQRAPNNRWMLLAVGVSVILFAEGLLLDMPWQSIYVQDILKVVGMLLVVTGPMKLLVTKKVAHDKYMKEVEIIEV